jgi:ribonuclease HI
MLAVVSPTIAENIEKLNALVPHATAWSNSHACRFDVLKFQLVHFTRNKRLYKPLSLFIEGIEIKAKESAKYLGLVLDQCLRWKEQADAAIATGTTTLLAVSRLTRPTFGMPHRHIRKLFRSVVILRMEYGLEVWYEPVRPSNNSKCKEGSVGLACRLGKVQRLAGRLITGAFKTTATDTLDYHAFLPPIHLRLNRMVHDATVRLATLPPSNPLQAVVKRCSRAQPQKHCTPHPQAIQSLPAHLQCQNHRPNSARTKLAPGATSTIAGTKEAAINDLAKYSTLLCMYSDGSGHKNRVGASAVAKTRNNTLEVRRHHLGSLRRHTVFEGEVLGTILALDSIRQQPCIKKAVILDNQAAIEALCRRKKQPGQYLIRLFQTELEKLLRAKPHLNVHLAWIPGHSGIAGNELADEEAQRAAAGESTPTMRCIPTLLKDLPSSAAALKAFHKKTTATKWEELWNDSKRAQCLAKFDRSPARVQILKFYLDLPRRSGSLITQLRMGHIGLNDFLYKIKAIASPLCPQCCTPETVDHFLLQCKRYIEEQHQLRTSLCKELNLQFLLSDPNHVRPLLAYVHATGRFPTYHNYVDAHGVISSCHL